MWLAATRVKTAPGSAPSRKTGSPVRTAASARGIGIPSAYIASPIGIHATRARAPPGRRQRAKKEWAPSLELNVTTTSVAVDHLAQKQRPPVAKLGREAAELVAGVRWASGGAPSGPLIAGKDPCAFLGIESTGIQPQFFGQVTVELNQSRRRHLRRLPGHVEALKFTRIGIVEGESSGGRGLLGSASSGEFLGRGIGESSSIILLDRNI